MEDLICKTYGTGKYKISMKVQGTGGEGLSVFVTGGDKPHLGGVALAAPAANVHGENLSSCDLWTMTVPGHKDGELARILAEKICKVTKEAVCVSLGVHVDHGTAEDIKIICDHAEAAADMFLDEYIKNPR